METEFYFVTANIESIKINICGFINLNLMLLLIFNHML